MKTLTVSDGGHRFSLHVREDIDIPETTVDEKPQHMQLLDWWRAECRRRKISYPYTVAEPMGIRVIQSLLKKHTLAELKALAHHFFLDHGDRLREDPRHFAIFASLVDTMKAELSDQA